MGWMSWLAQSYVHGVGSISRGVARGVNERTQRRVVGRGARAARNGVLGPADPDPPPGLDFYDYRGVARPRDVRHLINGPFRLGQVVDPHRGPQAPIGLTLEHLGRHAALLGMTGSGKTSSLVIPWICTALQRGASVVALDVTGDLLDEILDYRRVVGELGAQVAKWDFTSPSQSIVWDWLGELNDQTAVIAAVEALVGRDNPHDPQPFFAQRDRRVLRALIESILETQRPPMTSTLLQAARDQGLVRRLAALSPGSTQRLAEVLSLSPGEYAKAMSGVVNALAVFDHAGVIAVTTPRAGQPVLRLSDLENIPSLLVVGSPLHGSRTSVSTSALVLSQIIRFLYGRFGRPGRPVFLVVDEAARLVDRINYEELTSVSRRAGVSVVLALQTAGQIKDETERRTILDNCATVACLAGPTSDSARYLMGRLGQRQQSSLSMNQSIDTSGRLNHQYSRSSALVPVLGEREIMDPPFSPYAATVHNPNIAAAPVMVDLTRWDLVRR
jgi:type IV secretory pathway TraG/TraD family ATPase VirD4